jgi:hypothetical protein
MYHCAKGTAHFFLYTTLSSPHPYVIRPLAGIEEGKRMVELTHRRAYRAFLQWHHGGLAVIRSTRSTIDSFNKLQQNQETGSQLLLPEINFPTLNCTWPASRAAAAVSSVCFSGRPIDIAG